MVAAAYIQHVTIETGHVQRSYREDVDPALLAACTDWLRRACDEDAVALPSGWVLTAEARGPSVVAVVAIDGAPAATLGIARTSRTGGLWRFLGDTARVSAVGDAPPPAPWLATRLERDLDPMQQMMLTALARAIAWAWLTGVSRSPS